MVSSNEVEYEIPREFNNWIIPQRWMKQKVESSKCECLLSCQLSLQLPTSVAFGLDLQLTLGKQEEVFAEPLWGTAESCLEDLAGTVCSFPLQAWQSLRSPKCVLALYFAGKCECGKCTCYPPGDRRVYGRTCECDNRRCEDLDGVICGGEPFSQPSAPCGQLASPAFLVLLIL